MLYLKKQPFGPWLAVPSIAAPSQSLGKACRYDTSLSFRESEIAILLTGAKHKSHTEFYIHTGEALRAGWTRAIIQAIPRDEEFSLSNVKDNFIPLLNGNQREIALVLFVAELLDKCAVSDDTYALAKSRLGGLDSVLVEITAIVGYYTYVSYTLNVFRIPYPSSSVFD